MKSVACMLAAVGASLGLGQWALGATTVTKTAGTGSTTVFNTAYTASQSANEKKSSTLLILGSDANLGLVKFGLEYSRLFDTGRLTGKFSFYF